MKPRRNSRWGIMLLLLFFICSVCSCGGGGGGDSGSSSSSSPPGILNPTPTNPLVSISITPSNPIIPVGVSQQFVARGTYSDGKSYDMTSSVQWYTSNASVAKVNASVVPGGYFIEVKAVAIGTTTIKAEFGSISGSTTLTVNSATLSSISVTPANPIIPIVGFTQQFAATGIYSDGTSYDIAGSVRWHAYTRVAEVQVSLEAPAGYTVVATGLAAGTTTIEAEFGSISGSTTLTVNSATLSSISVTPANPIIPVGVSQQFVARGAYSDGKSYDITRLVTWSSSDNSLATFISSAGLARTSKAGTTSITATKGGISGSTTLTGQGVIQTGLSVEVDWVKSCTAPCTAQARARALYSDGSSQDVTTQVTWSSGSSNASVNQNGLVTIYYFGTVSIRATMGSFSGSDSATYI